MAQCVDCGVKVGCSCQLSKGRCSACNAIYINSTKTLKPYNANDKSKIS